MKVRSLNLGILLAACIGVMLTVGISDAGATVTCTLITGAGSSLQNEAQKLWKLLYHDLKGWEEENKCATEPVVNYVATSSGKGLAQWGSTGTELKEETGVAHFPAFIGTDVAPEGTATTGQIGNMDTAGKEGAANNEVMAIPVAQSAVAVLVSIPATGSCTATDESPTNEPKIKSLALESEWAKNTLSWTTLVKGAGVTCPEVPALYGRFSPSGTTAGFKRYFASLNTADMGLWLTLTSTAEKSESPSEWPIVPTETVGGEKLEKGSQLAKAVYEKPGTTGAIGYADLADALAAGFTHLVTKHKVGATGDELFYSFYTDVQNNSTTAASAAYASPSEGSSGESNCSEAEYSEPTEVKPNEDWSGARQDNTESGKAKAYPICTLTFDVAWHRYKFPEFPEGGAKHKYTSEGMNSVYNYLHFIVYKGQSELGADHYGAIPAKTLKKAEKALEKLPGTAGANIEF